MPLAALQNLAKWFLHFWFPRTCFSCGRDLPWWETGALCAPCYGGLKRPGPHICRRCGVVLKAGGAHCCHCRGVKAKAYKCECIRSAFMFNAASRGLVHALKYGGADYLACEMGRLMAERFRLYPELSAAEIIMPVPLYPKRRRTRGYNQSALLAQGLARGTGLACDDVSLVRKRDTVSQTTLGRQGRLTNMTGAFLCKNPSAVKGKVVLLVDDVATTGATLEGSAAALKAAGAKKVFAYTFARE